MPTKKRGKVPKAPASEVHIEGPAKLFSLDLKGEAARKWGGRVLFGLLLAAMLGWLGFVIPDRVLEGISKALSGVTEMKKELKDLKRSQVQDHTQVMQGLDGLARGQAEQTDAYNSLEQRVANLEVAGGR